MNGSMSLRQLLDPFMVPSEAQHSNDFFALLRLQLP